MSLRADIIEALLKGNTFCMYNEACQEFTIHIKGIYCVTNKFPLVPVSVMDGVYFEEIHISIVKAMPWDSVLILSSEFLLHPVINPFLAKHLPEIDKQIKALM